MKHTKKPKLWKKLLLPKFTPIEKGETSEYSKDTVNTIRLFVMLNTDDDSRRHLNSRPACSCNNYQEHGSQKLTSQLRGSPIVQQSRITLWRYKHRGVSGTVEQTAVNDWIHKSCFQLQKKNVHLHYFSRTVMFLCSVSRFFKLVFLLLTLSVLLV